MANEPLNNTEIKLKRIEPQHTSPFEWVNDAFGNVQGFITHEEITVVELKRRWPEFIENDLWS